MQANENERSLTRPTPIQIKLVTIQDCRREMARVYREARKGIMNIQDGTRLIYMLSQIGKLIESSELEQRLEKLEDSFK